ncbi:sensor histidine kinase [Streptomyces sp. MUM 203J]|uniref:sensor histidine kinase n=1 Tax=Streptomyces sp. MUM 203J TaxID=2791990 RepID=UPI001F03E89E|nr:sensor histidine kinase [Streptomyces sp. MUM 203J]
MEPEGAPGGPSPSRRRPRRTVRLRTLLVLLAVVPTLAMAVQVTVTAQRLLERSEHLRADVSAGERIGLPLYELLRGMQAERVATAARWSGLSESAQDLTERRAATDKAAAEFRRVAGAQGTGNEPTDRRVQEILKGLEELGAHRERADARIGTPDSTVAFYNAVVSQMIRFYQDAFNHTEDGELTHDSQVVVTLFSASEMLAQEDTIIALAGPRRELSTARFAEFVNAVGAHRHLYDRWIAPYLPDEDRDRYAALSGSPAWQSKIRIEDHVLSDHSDSGYQVRLPAHVKGWRIAHTTWSAEVDALNTARTRGLLASADLKAAELESDVAWLVAGSGGALLLVAGLVTATTRSVLRRLRVLHDRTVTVAEETLPDVVDRLRQGRPVDVDALPAVRGEQDEVGRISDAFARVVAVSVDGHRQLAAERHGFGMFAAGIASRTGNLVSRQLSLTEDLQDTFGTDEALLAQLMRADQLTVGMRRQIENLLILSGGEIQDPHTEPMRVADLLREAAAEVEDFRRIDRQALDEVSVEARVVSQISHLLAELLDNATRFSPPRSRVVIRAERVADGLSVEVEDRGPRVGPERYAEMNARLHSAPPYAVLAENAHRLGLFVVGHLADQLGATVTLRRSVYGGTSAVVIVPERLLVETEGEAVRDVPAAPPGARVTPLAPPASKPVPEKAPVPEPVRPPESPEPVLHVVPGSGGSERPALPPVRQAARDTDGPTRPPLPERVPQTHMAEQLRSETDAADTADSGACDGATPEDVADAWADYEDGTRKVEEELRQDQR